ncbi:MAG: type II secretion system protein GspD, partial [Nitrospirales bacterium]
MIRTFYLSNAKAKDMVNLLRTMLESKRVYVNEGINAVVVRETPDKLRLAERILLANDRREAEVEFDLEVLEVNRTKTLQYGLNFAKAAGAGVFPPEASGGFTAAQTFTYQQLTSLGSGSFLFTFPASVLMDFFKQESDAKTLANPKLRVVNNEKATINVGDKQPILLSTTNQIPTGAGTIPTTSTVTSIEFKDTGVKLTVEPTIHLVNELTLKLKIEVTRLGDEVTLQEDPLVRQFRFGTRTAETVLNMKDGETVVLAGLIQDEERKSRSSVPLLGDIPILGQLFSSTKVDTIQTEVVLAITPRIIRALKTPGPETQTFWSGTSDNYSTEPMFAPVSVKTEDAVPANLPFEAPQ